MKCTYVQTRENTIVVLETGVIYTRYIDSQLDVVLMCNKHEHNLNIVDCSIQITNTKEQTKEFWGYLQRKCEFI